MNNKGFTMIELLATIILLGLLMGIATYSIINTINKSKEKSEKIFVEKIGTAIESYLTTEGRTLNIKEGTETISFEKCRNQDEDCNSATLTELKTIYLKEITNNNYSTKIIEEKDLTNPKNNLNCVLNGKNPTIRIFKDSDRIYYYYLDLTNNSCEIDNANIIKSNLTKKTCEALSGTYENETCILG